MIGVSGGGKMERQTKLINEESDEPEPWDPNLQ
jgi:hypothetical protein